jgi:hypothetical protein
LLLISFVNVHEIEITRRMVRRTGRESNICSILKKIIKLISDRGFLVCGMMQFHGISLPFIDVVAWFRQLFGVGIITLII